MKSEVEYLKKTIDDPEKIKLKNYLEFVGIPKQENKEDANILKEVFKKLENDVKYERINSIYRAQSNGKKINVIEIALDQEETKLKVFSAAKEYYERKGNLTTR